MRSPRSSLVLMAAVAIVSACLGRWSSWAPLTALLGGLLAVTAVLSLPLGLIALLSGSLLAPLALGTGTATALNFTVLALPLLATRWVVEKVYRRDWRLLRCAPVPPLIGFAVVAVLAFAFSKVPWLDCMRAAPLRAQLGGLAVFLGSVAAFLLAADVLDRRWLGRLTWLFIGLGGLDLAGRLTPELSGIASLFQPGTAGSLFWTWLVALACGQVLLNRELHLEWRIAAAWVVGTAFYLGVAQTPDWVSGWLPPMVAVAVIGWVAAPRLALVLTLAAAAVVALRLDQVSAFVLTASNQYSLATRLEAWRIVAEMSKPNPVLGLGPATYYHCTPLFALRGYHVHFSSHNNFVDIVAQTGLLGLGCFLWFIWQVGRLTWGLRGRTPAGFERAYVYGSLGGLAGTLVAAMLADWLLPFVYNVTLTGFRVSVLAWLFLGGLVGLARQDRDVPQTWAR